VEKTYNDSKGFVISYKDNSEAMLFNELNELNPTIKLHERSRKAAAFYIDEYNELLDKIKTNGLIFAGHIHPFLYEISISGELSDFSQYIDFLNKVIEYMDYSKKYTCQCRIAANKKLNYSNSELSNLLSAHLSDLGYEISATEADTVISLTVFNQNAYLGISYLSDNLSDWAGGVLFYSKDNDVICRAEFKLEEAFKVFHISLKEGARAIDLGAAPGGWTNFLYKQGIYVDAVDPADMDKKVLGNSMVTHYKMTAQEFVRKFPEKKYDMIVNDMKMDTNESVDIICNMSRQLTDDGIGILTLKLPAKQVKKRIMIAKAVLSKKFRNIKMRQLYYNRSEITVYMEKPIR